MLQHQKTKNKARWRVRSSAARWIWKMKKHMYICIYIYIYTAVVKEICQTQWIALTRRGTVDDLRGWWENFV